MNAKQDRAEQAALKAEYKALLASDVWGQDSRMVEFCARKVARIVKLEGGGLVAIEKPKIKTSFCFGYSLSRYDSEDYDQANEMASHAGESTEYFISKNMEQITENIEALQTYEVYTGVQYTSSPENSRVQSVSYLRRWETPREGLRPISDADRAAMIEAWEIVGQDFRRKLDSYLKRYGLSKVKSWSYWQDE